MNKRAAQAYQHCDDLRVVVNGGNMRAENRKHVARVTRNWRKLCEANGWPIIPGEAERRKSCSCWMCGHKRYHLGPPIQERRFVNGLTSE